jgi:hypothetical protein
MGISEKNQSEGAAVRVVAERALIRRINRKLASEGQLGAQLHKYRGGRSLIDLGNFYVIDRETGFLVKAHVDLEELGREVGALAKSEELADERVEQ